MSIKIFFPSELKAESLEELNKILDEFNLSSQHTSILNTQRLEILNDISQQLITLHSEPEIVALGFWLRKSNILNLIKKSGFISSSDCIRKSPIGKVFHVAPANVPTMFMYSLAPSYILGNSNIIKISKRNLTVVSNLLPYLKKIKDLLILSYDNEEEITKLISEKVNARVVWGGDGTGRSISNIPGKLGQRDIIFKNKISTSIINCDLPITDQLIDKFLLDSMTFDQKACSSPTITIFIGKKTIRENFIDLWWSKIREKTIEKETLNYVIERLNIEINMSLSHEEQDYELISKNPLVVKINDLKKNYKSCGFNTFFQQEHDTLDTISLPENIQTITYIGFDSTELFNKLNDSNISRIVPIGQALNFSFIWDGYNILEQLTLSSTLL